MTELGKRVSKHNAWSAHRFTTVRFIKSHWTELADFNVLYLTYLCDASETSYERDWTGEIGEIRKFLDGEKEDLRVTTGSYQLTSWA